MIQCRKVLRQSAQTKVFLHIQQIKETILYSFWCMSFLNNLNILYHDNALRTKPGDVLKPANLPPDVMRMLFVCRICTTVIRNM